MEIAPTSRPVGYGQRTAPSASAATVVGRARSTRRPLGGGNDAGDGNHGAAAVGGVVRRSTSSP